jgi:hypothetical protein
VGRVNLALLSPKYLAKQTVQLFNANPTCDYCTKAIDSIANAANQQEAGKKAVLVHQDCAGPWLCSVLQRSIRKAKGVPDLKVIR